MNFIKNYKDYNNLCSGNSELSIIFCSLTFCQPCKKIYPKFEEISKKDIYKNICFSKVNIDELDDDEQDLLKDSLDLQNKKYPQIVFLQESAVMYHLDFAQFEAEFENIILLFI